MNMKKRILTLTAVLALMGSSLIAIGTSVAGQAIETSITVLETACVDDPTTLGLTVSMNPTWNPDDSFSPSSWIGNASTTEGARLNMDVSECAGGWTVNVTATDFTSDEGNVISTPGRFQLHIITYNGRPQHIVMGCGPFGCSEGPVSVPGTYGHTGPSTGSGSWGSQVGFVGTGPDYTLNASRPLMTGDETAVGEMYGSWGLRWHNVYTIRDTPPGEYTGTLKMTFTPVNP